MRKSGGAGETSRGRRVRRSAALALLGVFGALAVVSRVAVSGDSMSPTLEAGDRLLVLRRGHRRRLAPGDLVTVLDPRPDKARRVLVKRVADVDGSSVEVVGDNVAASTDSRTFGRLPLGAVTGKVLYRYAPPERSGFVH